MADRVLMTAEWLRYLDSRAQRREEEILQSMLQVPDYPPLPECPTCHTVTEQITSRTAEPNSGEALLVDFRPCGHGFSVPQSELLAG